MDSSQRIGPSDVTLLARSDFAHAGQVLGRAFESDPLWSDLMPQPELRAQMFAGAIKMVAAGGGQVETTPGVEAVALWMPPGKELGLGAFVMSGFAPMRWVVRTPWRNLRWLTALQRAIPEQRKLVITEPHWSLEVLGVDPDFQGAGLGSALVEAGLLRADKAGLPCYVDTSEGENVGFYSRFGFAVVKEITVTDLAAPFWMMVRPAVPRGE